MCGAGAGAGAERGARCRAGAGAEAALPPARGCGRRPPGQWERRLLVGREVAALPRQRRSETQPSPSRRSGRAMEGLEGERQRRGRGSRRAPRLRRVLCIAAGACSGAGSGARAPPFPFAEPPRLGVLAAAGQRREAAVPAGPGSPRFVPGAARLRSGPAGPSLRRPRSEPARRAPAGGVRRGARALLARSPFLLFANRWLKWVLRSAYRAREMFSAVKKTRYEFADRVFST